MAGIDATIPLGAKAPDPMQNLSGLLTVARGMQGLQTGSQNLQIGNQTLQQNQQKTQQGGIDLQERQAVQGVLADPSNYTDPDGNVDFRRAMPAVMRAAPTTGLKYVQDLMTAQKQHTDAQQSLNNLTTDVRAQAGKVLYNIPPDTPADVVHKTFDELQSQYRGAEPYWAALRLGYDHASQQGNATGFLANAAKTTMPQPVQQEMKSPTGSTVDTGNTSYEVNTKADIPGLPIGAVIPGTSVQKGLPPTQPTVGPSNQPGVMGPNGIPPAPGQVPRTGYNGGSPAAAAPEQLAIMQQERAAAAAKGDAATVAALDREMGRIKAQPGFVPTGPVPGANESKAGTVQVINDHWNKINAGAADAPVATALLSTIKQLAPGAITGTESGKRSYWNGLFNALHIGTQATGDLQKDTDLLNKAMAQLNLSTPATTDAMRTLVEAGRPHSTMSEGAIKDAAAQIEGQLKANMATRNLLAPDKRYADATGDLSHYQQKMETLQQVMDPRIFQYESMPKEDRKAFMAKLVPQDRAALIGKTKKLEALGVFQ